jgi:hypothetical protein
MPVSIIHVQYGDGSPARGAKVVLGFNCVMSRPTYADRAGNATVDHTSVGRARIYVRGRAYHEFHAPGRTAVTIST